MFHPTQARLKIVVGALSRSVARLQTICCLADSTLSASFCPGRAHSKKSDCPGALIIPPPTPSTPPQRILVAVTGLWWRSLICVFVCSAAAISRLFICSANTANTGFTAESACLHVLVAGKANLNWFHCPFFARARRACCGSLKRPDAKWLEFQKKGFCIFLSKILAFIIMIKMSLNFEMEQMKIHEVKRRHFSACGWGKKNLQRTFSLQPPLNCN